MYRLDSGEIANLGVVTLKHASSERGHLISLLSCLTWLVILTKHTGLPVLLEMESILKTETVSVSLVFAPYTTVIRMVGSL